MCLYLRPRQKGVLTTGKDLRDTMRVQRALTQWHRRLPSFDNASALVAAPLWREYLIRVYGTELLQTARGFPLNLRSFCFFHLPLLPQALRPSEPSPLFGYKAHVLASPSDGATLHMRDVGTDRRLSGRKQYEVYRRDRPVGYRDNSLWVYLWPNEEPRRQRRLVAAEPLQWWKAGFPSGSRVEVASCRTASKEIEYWTYLAIGSGNYFDLGRTVSFRNPAALAAFTKQRPCRGRKRPCHTFGLLDGCEEVAANASDATAAVNEIKCQSAHATMHQHFLRFVANLRWLRQRRPGLDTLQFTHTEEHGVYHFEIIDLRQHRWPPSPATACGAVRGGGSDHFFVGWQGRRRCSCDEAEPCLNCARN